MIAGGPNTHHDGRAIDLTLENSSGHFSARGLLIIDVVKHGLQPKKLILDMCRDQL